MFHREILVTTSEVDRFLSDCPREEHEESLFTTSLHSETPLTRSDTQWLSRPDSIGMLLANYLKIYDTVAEVDTIHRQVFK